MTADDFLAALGNVRPDLASELRLGGNWDSGLALVVRLDEGVLDLVRLHRRRLSRIGDRPGVRDEDFVRLARVPLPVGPPDEQALDARRLAGDLSLALLF